jgi:Polyglycine hydrolase-like, structural repeat
MRFSALVSFLSLAACGVDFDDPVDEVESSINGHVDPVRVHAILTANDDGSQAATATPADIQDGVARAKTILAAAGIELTFDPQSDISRMNSTLLNHDCTPIPGADLTDQKTQPQDCDVNNNERNRVALGFPGKLVMYLSSGDLFQWNDGMKMWLWGPRGYNWSNQTDQYVALLPVAPNNEVIAHEMGHYLHLVHTFYPQPTTMTEASQLIRDYVQNNGLDPSFGPNVFDGDGIDTPPDPGMALFSAAGLDPCNASQGTVQVPVSFANGTSATYFLTPDRENIMSYWNRTCRGLPPHMSAGQIARVRDAVENGNRQHLIAPKVLYSAVWEQGWHGQTRAIGWAFADFTNRMNQELGAGRHVVHMQAYDIGGSGGEGTSRIRWDGVWEPGSTGQSWVLGWAWNDIVKQHQAELAAGNHLVHMQAYDLGGGQIRWDAIWEPGSTGQSWVMGYAMKDFAIAFDQNVAAGNHFVREQAYDLGGGQIRWDAVWEPGSRGTTRAIGWAMKDIAIRFDKEIAAGKHCVHMQAYDLGGGQIRWDGVWEDGPRNTSRAIGWAFNDFVGRLATETAAGRGLVHMQAYDIGDGQIRYDGVWEAGVATQHRILSESIYPFADRFDAEVASEWHVVLMQAHTGR